MSMTAEVSPVHLEELAKAVLLLERRNFVARLAEQIGQPINSLVKFLPKRAQRVLQGAVRLAISKCLQMAIGSLDAQTTARSPSMLAPKLLTGVTGGLGGFFGLVSLPVELPLTTTLMFRSIAEIARSEGEDLTQVSARLACLEVFALGDTRPDGGKGISYWAARTVLARLTHDVATYLVLERGTLEVSTPVLARLIGEVAARFGLVVSERVAAGAIPIVGAIGGAGINVVFTEHFQRIARGHFTVRRLERIYGEETIRRLYDEFAAGFSSRLGQHIQAQQKISKTIGD
jgi:hypothetical protein